MEGKARSRAEDWQLFFFYVFVGQLLVSTAPSFLMVVVVDEKPVGVKRKDVLGMEKKDLLGVETWLKLQGTVSKGFFSNCVRTRVCECACVCLV